MYSDLFDYLRLTKQVGDSIQLDCNTNINNKQENEIKQPDGYRKIFKLQIFDSFEENLIAEMQSSLNRMRIEYSRQSTPDDANKFNSERAVQVFDFFFERDNQQYVRGLSWFRENGSVFDLNKEIEDVFKEGIMYIQGRDLNYKPTMVINPWKIDKSKQNLAMITKGLEILMAIMEEYMFYAGKVESWVVIIDTQQMSLFDIPLHDILQLFQLIQDHFPCTLERLYIIDPSLSLNLSWSEIEKNLSPQVREKIFFMDTDDLSALSSNYNLDQLDKRFGGNLENYPYWPPEKRRYDKLQSTVIKPQPPIEVQSSPPTVQVPQNDLCQEQQLCYVILPGQYQLPVQNTCDCSGVPVQTQVLNNQLYDDCTPLQDDDNQSYHRRFVSYNPLVDHPLLNKTYGDLDINEEPERSQINLPRPSIATQAGKQQTNGQERKSDLSFLYKHDGHCPECIKRTQFLKELNDEQSSQIITQPKSISMAQPLYEQKVTDQQKFNNFQTLQTKPIETLNVKGNQPLQNFNNQVTQNNSLQQLQSQFYQQPVIMMVPQQQFMSSQQQLMQFQQSTFSNPFFQQEEQDIVSYPEQNHSREVMFPNSYNKYNSQIEQQQMSFNQDQYKINQLISSQQFIPRMTDAEYQYHNYEEIDREIQRTGNKYNY